MGILMGRRDWLDSQLSYVMLASGKNLEKFVGCYRIASPAQIKKAPAPLGRY
jgi:hypothetical protein